MTGNVFAPEAASPFLVLGDAAVAVPAGAAIAILLLSQGTWKSSAWWMLLFLAGTGCIAASKLVFAACGKEIEMVAFKAASGHAMLAAAVYPTLLFVVLRAYHALVWSSGLMLGMMIGPAMGALLIIRSLHSPSEVLAGWIVGAAVSTWTIRTLCREPSIPVSISAALCGIAAFLAIWVARPVELEVWAKEIARNAFRDNRVCGPEDPLPRR